MFFQSNKSTETNIVYFNYSPVTKPESRIQALSGWVLPSWFDFRFNKNEHSRLKDSLVLVLLSV